MIAEHLAPEFHSIAVAWVWLPAGLRLIADQTLGLRSVIPLQSAHLLKEPRCEAFTSLTAYSEYRAFQFLASTVFLRLPEISSESGFVQPFRLLKTMLSCRKLAHRQ